MAGVSQPRWEIGRGAETVLLRLQGDAASGTELARRILALGARAEVIAPKSMVQTCAQDGLRPRFVISGWACRYCTLSDGRRQIVDLVLPGDGVGVALRPHPLAQMSVLALTPVRTIDASPLLQPDALAASPELLAALRDYRDAVERRALSHMVRLGRLSALERLAHLILEVRQRLNVVRQVEGDRFPFPLTQDVLADLTGLSVVHVNRTLQELKRRNLAHVERSFVRLPDSEALAQFADFGVPA